MSYCKIKAGIAFVKIKGKKHFIKSDTLDLRKQGITDIREIEGLEHFIHLRSLYLSDNQIKEIRGLERLYRLQNLWLDGNLIEELKGLEGVTRLQSLNLKNNPIKEEERYLIERNPLEIVNFCRKKVGMCLVVRVHGKNYFVTTELDLEYKGIKDIKEIE